MSNERLRVHGHTARSKAEAEAIDRRIQRARWSTIYAAATNWSPPVTLGLGASLGLTTGTPWPGVGRTLVGAVLTAFLALPFALVATVGGALWLASAR